MKLATSYTQLLLAGLLGCSASIAGAQDSDLSNPEQPEGPGEPVVEVSPGEQKVTQKLAGEFSEFAGENALPLVEALRTGSDLSYEVERQVEVQVPVLNGAGEQAFRTAADGVTPLLDDAGNPIPETTTELQTVMETVTVENTVGAQGFGNVKISMLLAEEMLAQKGLEGTLENISGSLFGSDPALADGVLEMRAAGAGWGEISQELLGTKLGHLMSGKNAGKRPSRGEDEVASSEGADRDARSASAAPKDRQADSRRQGRGRETARSEGALKPSQAPKVEKGSKPERVARAARAQKPERLARIERPVRPERPTKPERPARPERPSKPERPVRPERPSRPERPNR